MITVLLLLGCFFINSVISSNDHFHRPVKACHIGDVVQNECNKCLCTSKTVFECTPIDCNKTEIEETKDVIDQTCIPNQLYVQNLITCICTKDGRWPHSSCQDTFLSLPQSSVVKHKCDPDTYVVIDCNVCRCGPDGQFISNRCTKNTCDDDISRRHHKNTGSKKNSVYSNCEVKAWYSLAPCQFCYCVNENKLVCNTGNDNTKMLELGTYDMQICGTEMLKEALELIPESQRSLREGTGSNTEVVPETAPETTIHQTEKKKVKQDIDNEENVKSDKTKRHAAKKAPKNVQESEEKEVNSDLEDGKTNKKTTTTASVDNVVKMAESEEENEDSNSQVDNSNEADDNAEHLTIPEPEQVSKPTKSEGRSHKKAIGRKKMQKKAPKLNNYALRGEMPGVLNKMFTMELRKAMVSLDKTAKCVPGSTSVDGCNMCFCLKNGKMLCTSRKC